MSRAPDSVYQHTQTLGNVLRHGRPFGLQFVSNFTWAAAINLKRNPEKKIKNKKSDMNWIRTHDLCDTSALLYQLNYIHGMWEPAGSWNWTIF